MSTLRLLATNTVAQTISKAITVVTALAVGRMISDNDRGLGSLGFSDYSIIIAFAAYFYIICDFGFNAIAVKDISQDQSKTSAYVSNLLSLRLVLSAILILIALIILVFVNYSSLVKVGIIISLITIISQAVTTNSNILFQANLRYWQATLAIIAGSAVTLSISLLNYLASGGLLLYIVAAVLGSIVMAAISFILVNNQQPLRLQWDIKLWRQLTLAALPLGIAIILNLVYIRAGFFILSLHWPADYGLLSLAYRIFDVALVIPVFIVNALYPIMLDRLNSDVEQFKKLIIKSLYLMIAASLLVGGAVWLLAPLGITIATSNPQLLPSIDILRWLGWLTPIFFITNLLLWAIIALGKRKSVIFFYGIAAIISLSLNAWLVPQYGYWSIIFTTALTEGIIGVLLAAQLASLWKNITPAAPDDQIPPQTEQIAEQEILT